MDKEAPEHLLECLNMFGHKSFFKRPPKGQPRPNPASAQEARNPNLAPSLLTGVVKQVRIFFPIEVQELEH